jgi:poly-gamma-glutamate synthesis protein (capsule biosynthesis protein)
VDAVAGRVLALTGGAPLVLNLEGVLLEEPVVGLPKGSHLMLDEIAIPLLGRLNVIAAGLANNHSLDLGPLGLSASRSMLTRHRIEPLIHGEVRDLGQLRLLPLTFRRGRYRGPGVIRGPGDLDAVCGLEADPPLVALVHWGEEYTSVPGPAEREAALTLADCGVTLVVGAHSHQASTGIEPLAGGALQLAYSLGNFLFDQASGRTSGALIEVRAFRQGTLATRLVPLPNLFDLGHARRAVSDQRH